MVELSEKRKRFEKAVNYHEPSEKRCSTCRHTELVNGIPPYNVYCTIAKNEFDHRWIVNKGICDRWEKYGERNP